MEKTLSVFQCDRREKESGERLREWRLREELQTRNKRKKKRDREFLLSSLPPSYVADGWRGREAPATGDTIISLG